MSEEIRIAITTADGTQFRDVIVLTPRPTPPQSYPAITLPRQEQVTP